MNWTAFGAVSTFLATFVALFVACTEQWRVKRHRDKIVKRLNFDLILIPTNKWDSGANFKQLMLVLQGFTDYSENMYDELINEAFRVGSTASNLYYASVDSAKENSAMKQYLKGHVWFVSRSMLYWLDGERFYGVDVRDDRRVKDAMMYFVTTEYFKDALITNKGLRHDKKLSKSS